MNNVDVTNSVLDEEYNINIPIVLGDIHITITTSATHYTITKTINNGSFSNTSEIVSANGNYTTNVSIEDGYHILSVKIMMGKNDITSTAWNETDKTISIENVTDKIEISISTVGKDSKIIQNGLIVDIQYVNGKVVNAITGEEYTDIFYNEENKYFYINTAKTFNALESTEYTAELTQYYDENQITRQCMCITVNGQSYGFTNMDAERETLRLYYVTPFPTDQPLVSLTHIERGMDIKLSSNYSKSPIIKLNDHVYFSFSEDGTSYNTLINNISGVNSAKKDGARTFESITIRLNVIQFKHFRIYNRRLTPEEQKYNYSLYNGWKPDLELEKQRWGNVLDGIKDIGSPLFYTRALNGHIENRKSNTNIGTYTETFNDKNKEYNITDNYSLPIDLALDMSKFISLHFINPIKELRINQKYSILATPYPYAVGDKFVIKYASDNDEICGCTQGVLFPKKSGTVTITATILGTNITDTCKINIVENPIYDNAYTVPNDYKDSNNNPLIGGTTEQTTNAIFNAITYAHDNGYNKIIFPTGEYTIKPINITDSNKICYKIPNNICIDFNESTIFIEDNDYCKSNNGGYIMFRFTDNVKDSKIINANVHGERYNSTLASDKYTDNTKFVDFENCEYCSIEDSNLDSLVGFQIIFSSNNFVDYWAGEGTTDEQKQQGLGYGRGRIRYEDIIKGKLNDNGEIIEGSDADDIAEGEQWLSTKLLFFGHNKATAKRIKLGFMGDHWYTIGQRWYNVYWYDENKKLIRLDKNRYQYEDYDYPDNAVYFKISWQYLWKNKPTSNIGNDECVTHFYPMKDPKFCSIKRCKITNPCAYGLTFVGGCSCIIEDCYIEGGKRYSWSIDEEDGYLNQRHNIIANSMLMGGFSCPTLSSHTTFIGSYISTIRLNADCEQSMLIGNVIGGIYGNMFGDKQCMIFTNNYTNITIPANGYSGIIVENNNKNIENAL